MKAENVKQKVLALALAFAMLMAMMAPAFAVGVEEGGKASENDVEIGYDYIIRDINDYEPDQVELPVDEDSGGIALYSAWGPCGVTGCICTSCSSTNYYVPKGTDCHIEVRECTACNAKDVDEWVEYSHSFSGNTCTQCGYTKACSHSSTKRNWSGCTYYNVCTSCGETVSGPFTSHSWSSYSYTYKNSTTHTGTRYCTDCGTTSTTTGNHSTTNRYATYNDAQHTVEAYCSTCNSVISTSTSGHSYVYGNWTKLDNTQESRTVSCSLCTYTGMAYRDHVDGNGDGLCDTCNANMNVVVTFQHYGNVSNTVTVRYGSAVTAPSDPVRPGYDFAGWVDTNGNTYHFATPIYANTTITATWEARGDTIYTVNHYQQNVESDGYTLADTDHLTGTTDTTGIANERSYTGFRLNAESSIMEGNVKGDGTLTLNVYYDRVPLTISIDLAGKEETVDIRYGETLPVPEEPTRPGYDFVCWADGEGNEFDFSVPITGPVTLVAVWRPRNDTPYTVEHYQQSLTGEYILVESEELLGTTDTTATATAKTCTGFHEAIDYAGYVASGNIEADGSLVLALYYDRNSDTPYTVIHYWQTVDKEGYEQGAVEELFGVTGLTVTAKFQNFTGFHSNEEHPDNKISGVIFGDGALVLALYYDRDTITVSVDVGQDTLLIQEIPYGGTIPKPDDLSKPGYIFTGWKDENGNRYDFNTPITGDLVLTPSWQVQAPPQKWEWAGQSSGKVEPSKEEAIPSWMAVFGDTQLTRAQAVYVLTMLLNGEAEGMQLTTAFDDVCEETEYAAFISWANEAGIVLGYGHRLFGPTDGLTREQLAIMLYRLYGDVNRADLTMYADHDSVSRWAYGAVCWAVSKDLLPVEDDKLRPWAGVTGKELAALLEKAAKLSEQEQ